VLSSAELSAAVPEGRDAIRAAMQELKFFRYIKAVKKQFNGKWITVLKFTDPDLMLIWGKSAGHTDDGFSGAIYSCPTTNGITTSDLTTSDNSYVVLEVVTNVTTSNTREKSQKERKGSVIEMGWPIDEPKTPKRSLRFSPETDDDVGSVGKVVDKQALRNLKHQKTKIELSPASRNRSERPEEDWTTGDLIAEFYALVRIAAPGAPSQTNAKHLVTWINKQVGTGTERMAILRAIRMFFENPRVTRDPGIGKPMWQRFFAYYPTVYGLVTQDPKLVYVDEDFLAHQEKMFKLLEG